MTYESFFAFARCGALPPAGSAVTSKRLFLRYSVRPTLPFRCKGGAPATADLDYKLFSVRNILAWALAVEILGLAVLPALRAFFANRRDAALLSRPVGLVLAGWLAWALSLVLPFGFSRGTILFAVAVLASVSLYTRRRAGRQTAPFWGSEENRGALFFWAPAAIFLVIRAAAPEILGAEKFMDLAFFNSLTRRPDMPPADPWMAGNTINYYYWGYMLRLLSRKRPGSPRSSPTTSRSRPSPGTPSPRRGASVFAFPGDGLRLRSGPASRAFLRETSRALSTPGRSRSPGTSTTGTPHA